MWVTVSAIVVPLGVILLWFVRLRRRGSPSRMESPPSRGLGELVRREEEIRRSSEVQR
jgi:hypothetical protein